jgi:type I restriction enzyme S subunit
LRWLYYALQSVDLRGISQDVGVPGLSREASYSVGLPQVPSLDQQRRIADFLDDQVALLDRAIDLRQQQNALFRERINAELAHLYVADRHSYRRVRLQDLLVQSPCYGVLVPDFVDEGVPFIRVSDLPALERRQVPLARIAVFQSVEYRRTVVAAGDLLTSVVGTLGTASVVPPEATGANVARAVCRLRPLASVPPWFLRGWLATPQYLALAQQATGSGTAQATLNMGDLAKFPIWVPRNGAFEGAASAARHLIEEGDRVAALLDHGAHLLLERKQALITVAVTGQFDVTTARSAA